MNRNSLLKRLLRPWDHKGSLKIVTFWNSLPVCAIEMEQQDYRLFFRNGTLLQLQVACDGLPSRSELEMRDVVLKSWNFHLLWELIIFDFHHAVFNFYLPYYWNVQRTISYDGRYVLRSYCNSIKSMQAEGINTIPLHIYHISVII